VKKSLIAFKMSLLSISLSSCAGAKWVPPPPEVWQCGYSIQFDKFQCVNTKTGEKIKLSRDYPPMEAAQCLSADDYKKSEAWVQAVINIANERCK